MAAAEGVEAGSPAKKSDLRVRTLSAIVMVAVAGGALWLGGWVWSAFVLLVAAGVLWEWVKLAFAITPKWWARALWFLAGLVYVGVAGEFLNSLDGWLPGPRDPVPTGFLLLLTIVLCVVATDVGAYFAGRTIGGPRIAPRISPSKTWAGLGGGMLAASLVAGAAYALIEVYLVHLFGASGTFPGWPLSEQLATVGELLLTGMAAAVIAQAGDFFESWMKRRAGVKDSGTLIPGHGGLFDRVDGLLAVCFVIGLIALVSSGFKGIF